MTQPPPPESPAKNEQVIGLYYDLAVPAFSFGGALVAVLALVFGMAVDLRYTAAGCVIASFVLAYLAWTRPKKDIVALTTPIYAIIFFAVPLDDPEATVILELLYAASLTILLVRLKYRFGAPTAVTHAGDALSGPLGEYVERTKSASAGIPPAAAHRAAVAFLRFASGDYSDVPGESKEGRLALDGSGCAPAFSTAFEIVAEQADLTEKSQPRPEWYKQFLASDAALLAFPLPPQKKDRGYDTGFDVALDNALLLLFAGAWAGSEADRPHLVAAQEFARRLIEE
ncbi:MAG: hypothetical protein LUQ31_05100 [Methanoregula sp.]|nr:hypothetical protein [Methanoregula sp.]